MTSAPSQALLDWIDHAPHGHALDLGAGQGETALWLVERGFTVDAIERDERAFGRLVRRSRSLAIRPRNLDLADFHPSPDSYSLILASAVLHFLRPTDLWPLADRWFAALCIAVVRFGVGLEVLAVAQAKSLFFSLDVLMITWAAFLLFRVVDEGGAIQVLKEALFRLTTDPGMQALLIAWAFASFLQGVGGYGVPVAVTAPIMIGLGFSPVSAVVLPSLGHGWSVTFGSLAASFQALIAATGIPGGTLAR